MSLRRDVDKLRAHAQSELDAAGIESWPPSTLTDLVSWELYRAGWMEEISDGFRWTLERVQRDDLTEDERAEIEAAVADGRRHEARTGLTSEMFDEWIGRLNDRLRDLGEASPAWVLGDITGHDLPALEGVSLEALRFWQGYLFEGAGRGDRRGYGSPVAAICYDQLYLICLAAGIQQARQPAPG